MTRWLSPLSTGDFVATVQGEITSLYGTDIGVTTLKQFHKQYKGSKAGIMRLQLQ